MVVSDFNLICLNEKQVELLSLEGIEYEKISNNFTRRNFYGKKWRFLHALKGVWYRVFPKEEITTARYDDEFFDLIIKENNEKNLLDIFNTKNYYVKCEDKYADSIKRIVEFYLECSPTHQVCVLFRIEGNETDAVVGSFSPNEFFILLDTQQVKFNVIYLIQS